MRFFSGYGYAYLFWTALNLLLFPPLSVGGEADVVVRPLSDRIQVDGMLNEPIWRLSPSPIRLTQVEPHPGEPPTEDTKVWIAYSKDALYIAVRCEDSSPERIVASEMRRDAFLMDNDNIELVLDTYHDHRNAYYFASNAAGALVDGRITENQDAALEWDGIWNVRTRIDDQGWTAEFQPRALGMGIQYFPLPFPREGNVQVVVPHPGHPDLPDRKGRQYKGIRKTIAGRGS